MTKGLKAFPRVTIDPKQMTGMPGIRGIRVPVAAVVGMVAEGTTDREILNDYPYLEAEDIKEALRYAAETMRIGERPTDENCEDF